MNSATTFPARAESPGASETPPARCESMFRQMFERSTDAMFLCDPIRQVFVDCNQAAVEMLRASCKEELLLLNPADMSPEFQPDGSRSRERTLEDTARALQQGSHRFDWWGRRMDGSELIVEVLLTPITTGEQTLISAVCRDISDRKRSEAKILELNASLEQRVAERTSALAASEARFSAAFQANPLFIGVARMSDGKFVLVNDAFVNWSGYGHEEIVGRTTLELGLWEKPEQRELFWTDLRRDGSVRERECRYRNRAGKQFTMLISAQVIQLDNLPHMLAMALDITERKRVEEELRASEARLRESEARFSIAFHASPALIGILRVSDGEYVLANDAHLNWLGYSRAELIGHTCLELGLWENPAERELLLRDVKAHGSVRQRECRWRNRRGEPFTVLVSVETIHLNDEPHILVMALDITQRKRVEEELRASEARLRESEARFSVAFEASPMFINILRMSDGEYVWANDAFVNRLGYRREEILGRNSAEFGMWADPAEREWAWETMRTHRSVRQKEVRWLDRHGEPFTILLSAEVINFNEAPHILSMALDITQRKRAEVELLKTLEREKELSQLKSNFVSMVSHEFRTPLGIIQSSAELLRDFHPKMEPPEREDQLDSISRNARRMAGMMEEVLVLSRLDAGKLVFQPAALDLNLFCRRIVDEVLSATNRRCSIELSLNNIPTEAEADEGLLGHIFTNLLSNAVKYSEAGAAVHFFVSRAGRDAVCVIRDKGIGIPEEDQQHLFVAFHRGCNVGTRPGTGLGLLLMKRCADLHGGKVRIESQLGEGTTVTVTFRAF